MTKLIARPTDPYSKDWNEYWAQNPGLHRGVGAEAADDDDGKGEGDKGRAKPKPTPKDDELADLRARFDKLEENNKTLLAEKKAAKKAADDAKLEASKASGDLEAVENSWKEKVAEAQGETEKWKGIVNKLTIGQTAMSMSNEIAVPKSASVLYPHIEKRLTVEIKGDMPTVRVLGKDGKLSAMTVEELRAEFENDEAFAPMIVGSRADGSGKHTNSGKYKGPMKRSEMNAQQKADYQKEHGQQKYLSLPK